MESQFIILILEFKYQLHLSIIIKIATMKTTITTLADILSQKYFKSVLFSKGHLVSGKGCRNEGARAPKSGVGEARIV